MVCAVQVSRAEPIFSQSLLYVCQWKFILGKQLESGWWVVRGSVGRLAPLFVRQLILPTPAETPALYVTAASWMVCEFQRAALIKYRQRVWKVKPQKVILHHSGSQKSTINVLTSQVPSREDPLLPLPASSGPRPSWTRRCILLISASAATCPPGLFPV